MNSQPQHLNLSEAATYLGRHVKTLQNWDRKGILVAARTPTRRRSYPVEQLNAFLRKLQHEAVSSAAGAEPARIIAYCRVSSASQRPDLRNQRAMIEQFCAARGFAGVDYIDEVGGGLNFERARFLNIIDAICRSEVAFLVVAHKDRLARFGFELIAHLCKTNACELLVLNSETLSPEQEMVQDLLTIVHCFSSRLSGLRSYRAKLKAVLTNSDAGDHGTSALSPDRERVA